MDKKATALITGGSSGIGLEFARLFAAAGYDLVLVARDASELEKSASELKQGNNVQIVTIAKDLSSPNTCDEIYNQLKESGIEIEILVNNAGFGVHGEFHTTDSDRQLGQIDVNVKALTKLVRLFAPQMVARGHGKILNVGSTAAFQPGPLMAVYYATKSYVLSFSEALHEELKPYGVSVTCLCPGPTRTNFEKDESLKRSRVFTSSNVMRPSDVARAGFDALMKNKPMVIPGRLNNFMTFAARHAPRSLLLKISRWTLERR